MKKRFACFAAAVLSGFGSVSAICSCSDAVSGTQPPEPEHTHSYTERVVEPTCTEGGYTVHTCECGESYTDGDRSALGHDYTSWNITAEEHSRECRRCDETWRGAHVLTDGVCTECKWTAPKNATVVFTLSEDETSYTVTGAESDGTVVDIPAVYNGWPVTAVGDGAFENSDIASVDLPDSILSIGEKAFAGTDSLRDVVIPSSVVAWGKEAFAGSAVERVTVNGTVVGASAFDGCENLISVSFTDKLKKIDEYAFYACTALKNVDIPQSGVTVYRGAFGYTTSLEAVEVPAGTKWNGSFAFWKSGVKSAILHCGVGGGAFEGCESLGKVVIDLPEGTTATIGAQAFKESALSDITISSGITSISQLAFAKCKNLKTLVIPNTVKTIGTTTISKADRGVFMESGLTEIVIPDSVETMNDKQAFENCADLKSIHIGKNCNAKSIGLYRFGELLKGCNALETITVSEGHPHYYAENNCLIYKRYSSSVSLDKMGKNVTADQIPSAAVRIGTYAFYGNTELKTFIVPEGITEIENNAFYGCTNLASIRLPSTMKTLGTSAFENCGLTQITLPAAVDGIFTNCFNGCVALRSAIFENPDGWTVNVPGTGKNGEPLSDLTDPVKSAEYLTTKYIDKVWART